MKPIVACIVASHIFSLRWLTTLNGSIVTIVCAKTLAGLLDLGNCHVLFFKTMHEIELCSYHIEVGSLLNANSIAYANARRSQSTPSPYLCAWLIIIASFACLPWWNICVIMILVAKPDGVVAVARLCHTLALQEWGFSIVVSVAQWRSPVSWIGNECPTTESSSFVHVAMSLYFIIMNRDDSGHLQIIERLKPSNLRKLFLKKPLCCINYIVVEECPKSKAWVMLILQKIVDRMLLRSWSSSSVPTRDVCAAYGRGWWNSTFARVKWNCGFRYNTKSLAIDSFWCSLPRHLGIAVLTCNRTKLLWHHHHGCTTKCTPRLQGRVLWVV